ncbi:MAG: hypothetical protein ACYC6W_11755 [Nitrosotalea sp.]
MSILYPGALDGTTQFGQPSGTSLLTNPDHGVLHDNLSTLGTVLESVLGTTAGTSVLQNFAAGDFAVRINGGGTLSQAISLGTLNNGVLGTPSITGGTVSGVVGTATTNNIASNWLNVSNGTAVNVGSAAAPSAGQVLTATTGSAATWQSAGAVTSHMGTFQRDISAATASVGYTGVGFKPTSISMVGLMIGTNTSNFWGMCDQGTKGNGIYQTNIPQSGLLNDLGSNSILFGQSSQNSYISGTVASYDSDGFTVTYSKTGAPAGTLIISYIAYK